MHIYPFQAHQSSFTPFKHIKVVSLKILFTLQLFNISASTLKFTDPQQHYFLLKPQFCDHPQQIFFLKLSLRPWVCSMSFSWKLKNLQVQPWYLFQILLIISGSNVSEAMVVTLNKENMTDKQLSMETSPEIGKTKPDS